MKYGYSYETILGKIIIVEENNSITNIDIRNTIENYIEKETDIIKKVYDQLEEYFQGKRKEFDIPLNPKGTEFQLKVWDELRNIPYGKTKSYKDIACAIHNDKACRAIGNANGKNPIPIVIPCHRVIQADGSLGGYSGGLDIKKALLKIESNL